jgi:hypothetical protein
MGIFIASLVLCMVSFLYYLVFISYLYFITAGPRLTMNCLTDHRTWYNPQVCVIIFCSTLPLILSHM